MACGIYDEFNSLKSAVNYLQCGAWNAGIAGSDCQLLSLRNYGGNLNPNFLQEEIVL